MPYNTDIIKKQIFDKEPDEPLTAEEQDTLDEIIASEQPQEVNIDPDDPIFRSAFKLYLNLKKDDIASWEKIARAIGLKPIYFEAPKPRPKSRRLLLWMVATAATIILIAGFFWWNSTALNPKYITAKTGRGEIRSVSLPDGSTVVLSALSTIEYPEKFTDNERHVNLTGEAEFSVKSDVTNPFRVTASEKNIVATGTKFNIKAYMEDTAVKATLIHGVITVDNGSEKREVKEGDQAVITDKQITINKKVKIENVTAWQRKFIILEGETLLSIMQQIKRFYNIDFIIKGTPPALDLTDKVDANNPIYVILFTLKTNIPEANFEINKDSTKITVAIK